MFDSKANCFHVIQAWIVWALLLSSSNCCENQLLAFFDNFCQLLVNNAKLKRWLRHFRKHRTIHILIHQAKNRFRHRVHHGLCITTLEIIVRFLIFDCDHQGTKVVAVLYGWSLFSSIFKAMPKLVALYCNCRKCSFSQSSQLQRNGNSYWRPSNTSKAERIVWHGGRGRSF